MALAIPDTTLRTAAGTNLEDFLADAKTWFGGVRKFSIVANGGESGSFSGSWTLTPVDANETWHMNFRRISSTLVKVLIDPLGNVTGPGIPNEAVTSFPDTSTIGATGAGFVTKNVVAGDAVEIIGGLNNGYTGTVSSVTDENTIVVSPATLTAGLPAGAEVNIAPHLTDATESSGEEDLWQIAGGAAENAQYYINELDDALFFLHMNSGTTDRIPRGIHCGRVYVPFFTDGTNGDDYADGLGIMGYIPDWNGTNFWVLSNGAAGPSKIRTSQTTWHNPELALEPSSTTDLANIGGKKKLRPMIMRAGNTDGLNNNLIGYSKYLLHQNTIQAPGFILDGGAGLDAWVHIATTAGNDSHVIPWNRLIAPVF